MPLLIGRVRKPSGRAGRLDQSQGQVADLLHIAGPSRRFREARVPPPAPQRRLLGPRPPASAQASERAQPPEKKSPLPENRLPFDRGQGPLSPGAALARFQVPDDLELELVLAEPIVRQPVSISLRRARPALGRPVPAVSRIPPG